MAREGRLEVWEGMWLSSAILLPLGVFFTYKAVNDSAVFNLDAYTNFFRRLTGRNETRNVQMKEVIMDEVDKSQALAMLSELKNSCSQFLSVNASRQNYIQYWLKGYNREKIHDLSDKLETMVTYLSNSRDKIVINKLMDYPIMRSLWFYRPTKYRWSAYVCMAVLPVGLLVYLIGLKSQSKLKQDITTIINVSKEIEKQLLK